MVFSEGSETSRDRIHFPVLSFQRMLNSKAVSVHIFLPPSLQPTSLATPASLPQVQSLVVKLKITFIVHPEHLRSSPLLKIQNYR